MSDNVLKKEFAQKDVNRLRNLITKKYGDSTGVQSGYQKQNEEHVEGDVWEQNGKQWTIKDGIRQNVTKLDNFKQLSVIPLTCPECNNAIKTIYDKRMYNIHKKCLNCVTTYETQLKATGQYEEYAKNLIKGNINTQLDDYEEYLNSISENINRYEVVSEDGVIEKWKGGSIENIAEAKKQLDNARKTLNDT